MSFPEYPFSSHYANVHGQKMHFLDEGSKDAAPVVMVHGNPSWSFYFRRLVSALRADYRCIVPDHIGMGLSATPSSDVYPHTLLQRVDDLETLLEQQAITKDITLVLHDWGGMIGMAYAIRHPERIRRLVILNTSAFRLPSIKNLPWQLSLARLPLIGPLLIQGFNVFCHGAVKACVTRKPMTQAIANAYLAPYDSWQNRLAVLRFVQDIPIQAGDPGYDIVSDVEAGLSHFKDTPMLICWGLQDFVFDKHFLAGWREHFPGAEVHAFEDAGHYVLEDADDEILSLVQQFLNKHPLD